MWERALKTARLLATRRSTRPHKNRRGRRHHGIAIVYFRIGAGGCRSCRRHRTVATADVIVPVDGMSSEEAYNEQYAAWHMYKGGPTAVTDKTTVTRTDMIMF